MRKQLYIIYALLGFVVLLCCFFILYNANWLIGDDTVIMSYTGMGHAFPCQAHPYGGRFFPFSYLIYNLLYLFGGGEPTSVTAHYVIHAISFCVMIFLIFQVLLKEARSTETKTAIWVALFATFVIIERTIVLYVHCYSTMWFAVTVIAIFLFCTYHFYKKNSNWSYCIIALCAINYYVYMGEAGFVLPFSMGCSALLFGWRKLSKRKRFFNIILILIAIVFLLNYYFIAFRKATDFYDPAHGEDISIYCNAIKMFLSQKLLILVFTAFFWRLYMVFIRKEEFHPMYDSLLSGAVIATCGAFILRLNWNLYYVPSVLFSLPALIHYSYKYINRKFVFVLWLVLCLFFSKSAIQNVYSTQNSRLQVVSTINELLDLQSSGKTLVWYTLPKDNPDFIIDDYQRQCLQTYIAYMISDESFVLSKDLDSANAIIIHLKSVKSEKPEELKEFRYIKTVGSYELYSRSLL